MRSAIAYSGFIELINLHVMLHEIQVKILRNRISVATEFFVRSRIIWKINLFRPEKGRTAVVVPIKCKSEFFLCFLLLSRRMRITIGKLFDKN